MEKEEKIECKICSESFKNETSLHRHFKSHGLRMVQYYQKYYPRYDLHDGSIIKFKSKAYYFETDFNTRKNLLSWLKKQPEKEAKNFLTDMILKRKETRSLIYTPSQVEMRSTMIPSIVVYEKYFGDYYKHCEDLGFKNKYIKPDKIIERTEYASLDLKVYVDTRERKPLKFNLPTEVKTLTYGDYVLSEKNLTCNCFIERKSLADFISTLSTANYGRFCREIEKAEKDDANLIVLVEDTLTNALSFPYLPYISKKIRATPEYIFHNVKKIIQEHPSVQFLFVKGRKESTRVIEKIFFSECLYKEIDLQLAYDTKKL